MADDKTAAVLDENDVREIVRQVMNGKVVYRDTCEIRHKGEGDAMKEFKEKIKTLDGRVWAILVAALFQCIGVIIMLAKVGKGG